MRVDLAILACVTAAGLALAAVAETAGDVQKITSPEGLINDGRARTNYALNCQGCHFADATGLEGQVPPMANQVAKFLQVEGGREYLIRVPGMSNAAVSDEALAELANWTLYTFDADHIPQDFKPYTGEEVGALRRNSMTTGAAKERERLLALLAAMQNPAASETMPQQNEEE